MNRDVRMCKRHGQKRCSDYVKSSTYKTRRTCKRRTCKRGSLIMSRDCDYDIICVLKAAQKVTQKRLV